MSRLQRSCVLALAIVCAWTTPMAYAQTTAAPTLPRHLFVAPCLRPTVDAMMERSPTFRAQVETIAGTPALGLAISLDVTTTSRRAHASIRRYASGLLLATVRIHSLVEKEELIAHEIEHVLEQIEDVSLAALARVGEKAWKTGDAFESRRAIEAGLRVRGEMRQHEVLTARAGRPSP